MEISCIKVSFFIVSAIIHIVYGIISVGAQDILAGSNLQTSLVFMFEILPNCFGQILTLCIAYRVSYFVRFVAGSLMLFTAFMLIALSADIHLRLFGVALSTFSVGVIDTSTLGLASYFDSSVLSSYSAGSGVGYFIAPLYYTGKVTK